MFGNSNTALLKAERLTPELNSALSLASVKDVLIALANGWPLDEHHDQLHALEKLGLATSLSSAEADNLKATSETVQKALPARTVLKELLTEAAGQISEYSTRDQKLGAILKSTWCWLFSSSSTWHGYTQKQQEAQSTLADYRVRRDVFENLTGLLDVVAASPVLSGKDDALEGMQFAADRYWAISDHGNRILGALKQTTLDLTQPFQITFAQPEVVVSSATELSAPASASIFDTLSRSVAQGAVPVPLAAPVPAAQVAVAEPMSEVVLPQAEATRVPAAILPNVTSIHSVQHRQALEELVIGNLQSAGTFQLNNLSSLIVQHYLGESDRQGAQSYFEQVQAQLTGPIRLNLFNEIAASHLAEEPADYLKFLELGARSFDDQVFSGRIVIPALQRQGSRFDSDTRLDYHSQLAMLGLIRGKVSQPAIDQPVHALLDIVISDGDLENAQGLLAEFCTDLSSGGCARMVRTILDQYDDIDDAVSLLKQYRSNLGDSFPATLQQFSQELKTKERVGDLTGLVAEFSADLSEDQMDATLELVAEKGATEEAETFFKDYSSHFSDQAFAQWLKVLVGRKYDSDNMDESLEYLGHWDNKGDLPCFMPATSELVNKAVTAEDAPGLISLLGKYSSRLDTRQLDRCLVSINKHGDFDQGNEAFNLIGNSCSLETFSTELGVHLVDEYEENTIESPIEYLKSWRGQCDHGRLLQPIKELVEKALERRCIDEADQVLSEFFDLLPTEEQSAYLQKMRQGLTSGEPDLDQLESYLMGHKDDRDQNHLADIAVVLCSEKVKEDTDEGVELFGALDDEGAFGQLTSEILARSVRALLTSLEDNEGAEALFVAHRDRMEKDERIALAGEVFG